MRSGFEDLRSGGLTALPWWADALLALFIGFGGVQDSARRLGDATNWSLAGHWLRIVVCAAILLAYGWTAIAKLRRRRQQDDTADVP